MSRRDSDSKRHSSRFDQEPSPKRSRRDGKPKIERSPADINLDNREKLDRDQKHHHRLQDALPLEPQLSHVSRVEMEDLSKESDNADADRKGTKYTSNPTEVPRSRSYFQHDEHGNAGQVGRSFSRRVATEHRRRRDPKEQQSERANRTLASDGQKTDELARVRVDDKDAWHHDRYMEMEADPKPLARKRPSFREKKIPDESGKSDFAVEKPNKPNVNEHPVLENEKRNERGGHNSHHLERSKRAFAGNREANRGEAWRGNFSSRDQYSSRSSGNYRGRERLTARRGHHPTGGRVEKWKHDLFDEANRSPSPKNEEDMVAKVEALLAS